MGIPVSAVVLSATKSMYGTQSTSATFADLYNQGSQVGPNSHNAFVGVTEMRYSPAISHTNLQKLAVSDHKR